MTGPSRPALYRLAQRAQDDIRSIWAYVAKHGSEQRADRLIDRLHEGFQLLADGPERGRARDELRPGVRGFPIGEYVILYRTAASRVVILRVWHGKQDPARLRREL